MKHLGVRRLLRLAAIFSVSWLGLRGQSGDDMTNDGPARFHDVERWRGTLVAKARPNPDTVRQNGDRIAKGGRGALWSFGYSAYYTVSFLLDEYESDPSIWTGRVTGSTYTADYRDFVHYPGNYANKQTWWKGYSDHEWMFTAGGPLDFGDDPKVTLRFHGPKNWSVDMPVGRAPTLVSKRWYKFVPPLDEQNTNHDTTTDDSVTTREIDKAAALGMRDFDAFPYPKKGLVLEGTNRGKAGQFPLRGSAGFSPEVLWDYTVYLEPASKDELQLEIEIPGGYDTWRPITTADTFAGEALNVTARLVTASGRKPETRVQQFVWELVGTSREPGVAMNFPVDAKDDRFDLELEAEGGTFVLLEKNQRLERAVREGFSDSVKVVPYDWGGWSTLQVTAILADGRRVVGKLKEGKETGLRIPKRAIDSKIADGWKKENNISGPDDLDDDNAPVGDGAKGDGFTLYEEYRGFYQATTHLSTSPKKKDLFIEMNKGREGLGGVALFRKVTQLSIHPGLQPDEFPDSRIMNANRRQGAHVGPQHGIRMELDQSLQGISMAYGGPGSPAKISKIGIMSDAASHPAAYVAATVAHELGHCVNLWHHGEGDVGNVAWTGRNGVLLENGGPITVLDERSRADLTAEAVQVVSGPNAAKFRRVWVGSQQGQHAGTENCLMRYDCAQAVEAAASGSVRLFNIEEVVGSTLCGSPAGTGVNLASRQPSPRYGPAQGGRGNCIHQIHVSDAVAAPSRDAAP